MDLTVVTLSVQADACASLRALFECFSYLLLLSSGGRTSVRLMGVLADLDAALATDLSTVDEEELKALGSLAQNGRKVLAGFVTRLAIEAKGREETGSGAPTENVLDPDGEQSATETDNDTARAGLGGPLPLSGRTAAQGTAKVENANHLARRTGALSETELERLAAHDRTIARNQVSMRPERFRSWLDRLIAQVRDRDDELSAAEKAILSSAFRLVRRPDGSWDVIGRIDGERGTVADDIIERRAYVRSPTGARRATRCHQQRPGRRVLRPRHASHQHERRRTTPVERPPRRTRAVPLPRFGQR